MTNDKFNLCMGAAEAAGYKVDTPIVNAIIANLAGTLPTRKCEIGSKKCIVCNCIIHRNVNLEEHVNGSKHKKNVVNQKIIAQIDSGEKKGIRMVNFKFSRSVKCDYCDLTLNSPLQLQLHLLGSKHKKMAEICERKQPKVPSTINLYPAPNQSNKTINKSKESFKCDVCNVFLNSKIVLLEHLNSSKHKLKQKKYNRSRTRMKKYGKIYSDDS